MFYSPPLRIIISYYLKGTISTLRADISLHSKQLHNNIQQLDDIVQQHLQLLNEKEKQWEELQKKVELASAALSTVVLNVGGMRFETSKSTLLSHTDTFFTAMLCSDRWKPRNDGSYFIDRSPKHFGRILDYLRTDKLPVADLHKEQIEWYVLFFINKY